MSRGGIGFLVFFISLNSCAAQQVKTEFYEGLKKRQEGAQTEALACFEKSLNDPNTAIAAAAAVELMSLHSAGVEISPAVMTLIRQKADGSWARALDVSTREELLDLLLNGDSRAWDEAVRYVLNQCMADSMADAAVEGMADSVADGTGDAMADGASDRPPDGITAGGVSGVSLTEAENAVIAGRSAASLSRYREALIFFRMAVHDSPGLFFRYPDLLTDLGRAFQYAAAGREGIDLFLQWEKMLGGGENAENAPPETALRELIPAGSENLVRFRLLFFAARIARQRGEKNNIELFEKALPCARAVAPEQADACIWYILDSSLAQSPDTAIRYLETYSSQWHDDAYFSDVLDKLARELVFRRQWEKVYKVFTILRNRPGVAALPAHYAWLTGRAIEEGLFSPDESAPDGKFAQVYMRIAYNAAGGAVGKTASAMPLYYRSFSATALGAPFLVLPEEPLLAAPQASPRKTVAKNQPAQDVSDTMQFLMGFFENDAARYAIRYIRAAEGSLSPEELRRLAEALGTAGQYQESMRLVSLYANRDGYSLTRRDLELLYPRPFKELVEQYAKETGLDPPLLFGLIRAESAFDPNIISRAGAVGLTQLMPATAEEIAARIRRRGGADYIHSGEDLSLDLRDPAVNIHIGATYLAYLNERMEDPLLALLAYNGGMNRVRRWRTAAGRFSGGSFAILPPDLFLETVEYPETRNYGRNVMGAAAMYTALYY